MQLTYTVSPYGPHEVSVSHHTKKPNQFVQATRAARIQAENAASHLPEANVAYQPARSRDRQTSTLNQNINDK